MKNIKNFLIAVGLLCVAHTHSMNPKKSSFPRKTNVSTYKNFIMKNRSQLYPVWESLLDGIDMDIVNKAHQIAIQHKMNMQHAANELLEVAKQRIRFVCEHARKKSLGFEADEGDIQHYISEAKRDIYETFGVTESVVKPRKKTHSHYRNFIAKNRSALYPVWEDLDNGINMNVVNQAHQIALQHKMNMKHAANELLEAAKQRIRFICIEARKKKLGFEADEGDIQHYISEAKRDIYAKFGV